jgi:hypothetical protein
MKSLPAALVLNPAYNGQNVVHKQADKFLILKFGQRFEAVALDRLKPHLGEVLLPVFLDWRSEDNSFTFYVQNVHSTCRSKFSFVRGITLSVL